MRSFDRIAWVYDFLKHLIFGVSLDRLWVAHFYAISAEDKVLILGGGTGEILLNLPSSCQITFLDHSAEMIHRAKARAAQNVSFIRADFITYSASEKYDWIICPFFLDVFEAKDLEIALHKIMELLLPSGRLIVTDFQVSNRSQSWLVWLMYTFFRATTGLSNKALLPIHELVLNTGFLEKDVRFSKHQFVFSRIYEPKRNLAQDDLSLTH